MQNHTALSITQTKWQVRQWKLNQQKHETITKQKNPLRVEKGKEIS